MFFRKGASQCSAPLFPSYLCRHCHLTKPQEKNLIDLQAKQPSASTEHFLMPCKPAFVVEGSTLYCKLKNIPVDNWMFVSAAVCVFQRWKCASSEAYVSNNIIKSVSLNCKSFCTWSSKACCGFYNESKRLAWLSKYRTIKVISVSRDPDSLR